MKAIDVLLRKHAHKDIRTQTHIYTLYLNSRIHESCGPQEFYGIPLKALYHKERILYLDSHPLKFNLQVYYQHGGGMERVNKAWLWDNGCHQDTGSTGICLL